MVDAKAIKDKVSKKINNTRSKISSRISSHKHCRICGINIDAKAEPRICKNAIANQLSRREKNDRMMRIMFFIFVGIFFVPILLSSVGILAKTVCANLQEVEEVTCHVLLAAPNYL